MYVRVMYVHVAVVFLMLAAFGLLMYATARHVVLTKGMRKAVKVLQVRRSSHACCYANPRSWPKDAASPSRTDRTRRQAATPAPAGCQAQPLLL